jgi:hypothetical protein
MHSRGYWLVSDDIAALRFEDAGDVPMMVPGYPQFKLWPEAAALLGDVPEELPRLNPDLEKRGRPVSTAFASAPLPLKRIYLLDQGEVPEIEQLSPQESFSSLLHHTYGRLLFQAVRTSSHFLQCARVVKSVPIRRLRRPYSLNVLPEVARLIAGDSAPVVGSGLSCLKSLYLYTMFFGSLRVGEGYGSRLRKGLSE